MVVQKYHIICNGSTDIFTIRLDLILGVPRKFPKCFFVITSARNELAKKGREGRIARKGWRGKEGKDSEERIARKG